MLLRENYARYFIPSSRVNNPANNAFSTVAFYPEEDITEYLDRRTITYTEYVRHDVKRYFGLSIEEYLNLTYKEKYTILKVCEEEAKHALKAAEEAKKKSNAEIDKIKESMTPKLKVPKPTTQLPNSNVGGFDFEELYGE